MSLRTSVPSDFVQFKEEICPGKPFMDVISNMIILFFGV